MLAITYAIGMRALRRVIPQQQIANNSKHSLIKAGYYSKMIKDVNNLISLALREDVGKGDITSNTLIPANQKSVAFVIAKEDGVIAGLPLIKQIFQKISSGVSVSLKVKDGAKVKKGAKLAVIKGPTRAILTGERTVLNFIQRLSGIATLTNKFVQAVKGTKIRILDTRKTVPGWRMLDKYAVKMGGGVNHRIGLFDAVLIKNNHLKSLERGVRGSEQKTYSMQAIVHALELARTSKWTKGKTIEIEVRNLDEFFVALIYLQAYSTGRAVVMLDNMTADKIKEAVKIRNLIKSPVLLEISGGVNQDSIREYAKSGVDFISVGALTHSPKALDIALRVQ